MPKKQKEIQEVPVKEDPAESPNLEIFHRIECCPFCGSHASHLARFTIYWQCNICHNKFVGEQRI